MLIFYAVNFVLKKHILVLFALLITISTAGCSNADAQAAKYASEAQSYLEQNRIAEARLTIKKAILARDDVSEYHLLQGRIEYAAESFENAFAAYSEALALDASNQEALQAVSQLGLRVGRYDDSVNATSKLLVLNPNQKDALLTRGLHGLIKRDYADAVENADKILNIDALDEGGVVLKARASFLSGNAAEAIKILENYELSRPNTAAVSMTRLEIYRALRNSEQIRKQFVELTRMRPDDLTLRLDEANLLYKIGDRDQATKILIAVMADEKASPEQVRNILKLWREYSVNNLGSDQANAIAASGGQFARISGARYFAESGDLATANILIGTISGDDADAERANIALLSGRSAVARSILDAILARDATHCAALGTQASLWFRSRKYAAALRSAQTASSECPDQYSAWILTARAYSALGDQANARRVFRQGIAANKQSEPLTRAYSHWLLTQGNTREAVAAARMLTRSAPALNSGWRLYSSICAKAGSDCTGEANEGLKDSQTRYGVDLLPGELPPNGLFGRLVIR